MALKFKLIYFCSVHSSYLSSWYIPLNLYHCFRLQKRFS